MILNLKNIKKHNNKFESNFEHNFMFIILEEFNQKI